MNEHEKSKAMGKGELLRRLMVKHNISEGLLARKSGLPLLTVRKAMTGGQLSGVIYDGLIQACYAEEAPHRPDRPGA